MTFEMVTDSGYSAYEIETRMIKGAALAILNSGSDRVTDRSQLVSNYCNLLFYRSNNKLMSNEALTPKGYPCIEGVPAGAPLLLGWFN